MTGPTQLDIQETDRGVLIRIKVVPGASRSKLAGVLGDAVKIALASPPEKGKANKALVKLLADHLGISKNDISIQQGLTSAHKRILIEGVTMEQVLQRLHIDS